MSVFSIGKRFIDRYPCLLKLVSFCYNFASFNSVKGKKGNLIVKGTAFMYRCKININGTGNKIVFGNKCLLKNCSISVIGNNNKIILGDTTCIHKGDLYIENDNNVIDIDEKTLICGPSHIACIEGTTVKIGKDCLFSSETHIRTGDSHSVLDLQGNRINYSKNVVLGNHVWLGYRAVLTKGAEIPDNSVVSLGAIVTKTFDTPNIILGGVPAKIVKDGINWCKERI
jgi:carbonic anhydrase/acetyltransferase-like protein (isoleucine patch superfamily)